MSGPRFALGAAVALTAVLLQSAVLGRLPLPGPAPDLLVVVVVAFALVEGALSGMVTGFVLGVLADLQADHEVGRVALAYVTVGYLVGLLRDDGTRTPLLPFLAVAAGSAATTVLFAVEGVLLGDPRVTAATTLEALGAVPYAVVLTPFVVPAVGALVRRLDPDPLRR